MPNLDHSRKIFLCTLDEILDFSDEERSQQQFEVLIRIITTLGYGVASGTKEHTEELYAVPYKDEPRKRVAEA